MGRSLFDAYETARTVFARVANATGQEVSEICFNYDEDTLRLTQNAQLALFTVGVAAYECMKEQQLVEPSGFAGHSVGEYAALVASGVLSVEDGACLVAQRGELMSQADSGAMAAVLGLERDVLQEALSSVSGVVVIANDNCPGQLVISGQPDSVKAAAERAVERGAKRVLPLNVSGAFHSPLMHDAAEKMALALQNVTFHTPSAPVYCNVRGTAVSLAEEWPVLLKQQLESSVLWTDSVRAMIADQITTFVECGAGEVLLGLLKRTDRETTGLSVNSPESLQATVDQLRSSS